MRRKKLGALAMLASLSGWVIAPTATAALIDFEGFDAGTLIDDEYMSSFGVMISGTNIQRDDPRNVAAIFDSNAFTGGDKDLASPFSNTDGSDLGDINPGNILILHERPNDCVGNSCGSNPDDEGRRRAGFFEFSFAAPILLQSIDFFDVEGEEAINFSSPIELFASHDLTGVPLLTPEVPNTGGDNQWTRVDFANVEIRSLRINMPGSGAIDNIKFEFAEVPVPSTLLMMASLLPLLRGRDRQRIGGKPAADGLYRS